MSKEHIEFKIDWFGDKVTVRFHKQDFKHQWERDNIAAHPESGFTDIRTYISYRIVKAMYTSGKFKNIRLVYENTERMTDVMHGYEQGYTHGRRGEAPKFPQLRKKTKL